MTESDDTATEPTAPDVETRFDLLANRRRRLAIHYLQQVDEPVTIGALSDQVAAWESGKELADVTTDDRKRMYTALQQSHLPRMEAANIVEYDKERKRIVPTDTIEQVTVYEHVADERTLPWKQSMVAVCLLFGSVVSGLWLDVGLVTALSPLTWATIFLCLIVAMGIFYKYTSQDSSTGPTTAPPEIERSGKRD